MNNNKVLRFIIVVMLIAVVLALILTSIKQTLGNTDIVKNDVRIQKVIDMLVEEAKLVEPSKDDSEA
ncbi:hypothetical protein BUY27_12450 [Staphylococcus cohnii]|nr:hypothetical protein BUY27_12450 [Staphylococcus cohnii]